MIPNYGGRTVDAVGIEESSKFGISIEDEGALISLLRDTIYTDKVKAVLREYSANAWDAHVELDKADVPIKVTLPTAQDPTLFIQDFGPGLSHEDVFRVYTKYGKSTKRTNAGQVGMLGIGCKSGFAYSDTFTISSRHGGKCRTYIALLDETDIGTMNLLSEEDCPAEETGITVQIPVRREDIWEFHKKAISLFQYFRPHPIINVSLPAIPSEEKTLVNGTIYDSADGNGEWVAVMGCVPYRIDVTQLTGPAAEEVKHYLKSLSGSLTFKIGEVKISGSREELRYSKDTKEKIVERFNALIDEYVTHTMNLILKDGHLPWEKRIKVNVVEKMGLPIPKDKKDFARDSISLLEDLEEFRSFKLHKGHQGHNVRSIDVDSATRIVWRNDDRARAGFDLGSHDYVVDPLEGHTIQDAKIEMAEFVKRADIGGIPEINISTLHWYAPSHKGKRNSLTKLHVYDPRHKAAAFRLNEFSTYSKRSQSWDVSTRVMTDKDVFVLLERFQISGSVTIRSMKEDKALVEALGGAFPEIYAYKSTGKKPLTKDKCIGVHYEDWFVPFVLGLITPKQLKLLSAHRWSNIVEVSKYHYKSIVDELGEDHLIVSLLDDIKKADKILETAKKDKVSAFLGRLNTIITTKANGAKEAIDKIYARYPLLQADNNIGECLWPGRNWGVSKDQTQKDFKEKTKHWYDYVRMVDKYEELINVYNTQNGNHQRNNHNPLGREDVQRPEGCPELSGPEAGDPGEELGEGSGILDGESGGEEVGREGLCDSVEHSDVQGAGASPQHHAASAGDGDDGRGSEQRPAVLGTSSEEPILPLSESALGILEAFGNPLN